MRSLKFYRSLAVSILFLSLGIPGSAHNFRIGPIRIDHPIALASLPGQTSAVVYFRIENAGAVADRLIALESPAAQNVAVHRMTMNGSVMAMRELDNLQIDSMKSVALSAGSQYHVMMTGLKQPLVVKDKIPLTLTFERAGKLEVMVEVESNAAQQTVGKEMGNTKDMRKAAHAPNKLNALVVP